MKISTAAFSLSYLTFEQAARVWSTVGMRHIDVGVGTLWADCPFRSNIDTGDLLADAGKVADRMRRVAEENGLSYANLFRQGTNFYEAAVNHPDPNVRESNKEWFAALVAVCKAVGIPSITLLPGMPYERVEWAQCYALARQELTWMAKAASDAGLFLCIEPHLGSVVERPEDAKRLAEETPGLKLTLDYSHFVVKGLDLAPVHELVPFAGHFHARHCAPGQLQTGAEASAMDFPDILGRLKAVGYNGFLSIEYTWLDWEGCKNVDVAAETLILKAQLTDGLSQLGYTDIE